MLCRSETLLIPLATDAMLNEDVIGLVQNALLIRALENEKKQIICKYIICIIVVSLAFAFKPTEVFFCSIS